MFERIVIVDWSAANQRKKGRDSIWVCQHGKTPVNLATRTLAQVHLEELLDDATDKGERTLIGFDFPFGYPVGFAAALGLSGPAWRATWDEIARLITDDDDNRNNRFYVGAELNRRVSGVGFPFWGCPASKAGPHLHTKFHNGHGNKSLAERRLIDEWMVGAQPCWKLAYTGSVGSQALTGIPVVRRLRNHPRWAEHARIWPFETGLQQPAGDVGVVFAEVWPSWWRDWKSTQSPDEVNDEAQVRHVARVFAEQSAAGSLPAIFSGDPSLTGEQRSVIEAEEAWTLGVTAPRVRATKRRSAPHPDPLPACGERVHAAEKPLSRCEGP